MNQNLTNLDQKDMSCHNTKSERGIKLDKQQIKILKLADEALWLVELSWLTRLMIMSLRSEMWLL